MSLDFPYIFPLNLELTEFDGFISLTSKEIRTRISIKENDILINLKWQDAQLLKTEMCTRIQKKINSPAMLFKVLQNLKNKWELVLCKDVSKISTPHTSPLFYSILMKQIEEIGWEKVQNLDEQCQNIKLINVDESGRKHTLEVILTDSFPEEKVKTISDLPVAFTFQWNKETNSLSQLYEEFKTKIKSLQIFWNCMDHIDQNLRVLEPENPLRKDCKRRITITNRVSLLLTIDPLKPLIVPNYQFLGPDEEVSDLNDKLTSNLLQWNESILVMENFRNILEFEFINQNEKMSQEIKMHCGICYSYFLNDAIPDKSCNDLKCKEIYHQECLHEWLKSLETTHYSCQVLFGECPLCKKKISCNVIK